MGRGKMNLSPSTCKEGTRSHPQGDCSSGGEWTVGQGGLPWATLNGDSGTAAAVHTRARAHTEQALCAEAGATKPLLARPRPGL